MSPLAAPVMREQGIEEEITDLPRETAVDPISHVRILPPGFREKIPANLRRAADWLDTCESKDRYGSCFCARQALTNVFYDRCPKDMAHG